MQARPIPFHSDFNAGRGHPSHGLSGDGQRTNLVVQRCVHQIYRHLAHHDIRSARHQQKDQNDGHHGDEKISHDQPVAKPPDDSAHAPPGQLVQDDPAQDDGPQHHEDLQRLGGAGEVEQRPRRRQDEERLLDPAEPAPIHSVAPHGYRSRLAYRPYWR